MYFNVNFNVFLQLIKVHLLVSELYMHSLYFDQHKTDTKMKLCIGKAILNGIRKAECIAHRISGRLSVEESQNLLFITTYVLQFRSTAKFTKTMSYRFQPTRI